MIIAQTPRLQLRHLKASDTAFLCELLNDPDFIANIADRGVRTQMDALQYLTDGPIKNYKKYGYGLFLVELADNKTPIGLCGLSFRESLRETDLGFAFLPQYRRQGYAFEAASAVMRFGYTVLNLKRIVAIVSAANIASISLLERLGFRFEKTVHFPSANQDVLLYS